MNAACCCLQDDNIAAHIASEGRFLLQEAGEGTEMLMNEALLGTIVTVKAKYLLNAILTLLAMPLHPNRNKQYVEMEDISKADTAALHAVLRGMCKHDAQRGHEYILDLESRFSLRRPGSSDVDTWSSMWARVFKGTVASARKCKEALQAADFLQALPPATSVVTQTFFGKQSGDEVSGGTSAQDPAVKQEVQNPSSELEQTTQTNAYFDLIYTLSNARTGPPKDDATHTLDVVALQAAVQQQLLMHAGQLGEHGFIIMSSGYVFRQLHQVQ